MLTLWKNSKTISESTFWLALFADALGQVAVDNIRGRIQNSQAPQHRSTLGPSTFALQQAPLHYLYIRVYNLSIQAPTMPLRLTKEGLFFKGSFVFNTHTHHTHHFIPLFPLWAQVIPGPSEMRPFYFEEVVYTWIRSTFNPLFFAAYQYNEIFKKDKAYDSSSV